MEIKNNLTKNELAVLYGVSPSTIRKYLNNIFFKDLQAVGYRKQMRVLTPKIVRLFMDLYGLPLKSDFLNKKQ